MFSDIALVLSFAIVLVGLWMLAPWLAVVTCGLVGMALASGGE